MIKPAKCTFGIPWSKYFGFITQRGMDHAPTRSKSFKRHVITKNRPQDTDWARGSPPWADSSPDQQRSANLSSNYFDRKKTLNGLQNARRLFKSSKNIYLHPSTRQTHPRIIGFILISQAYCAKRSPGAGGRPNPTSYLLYQPRAMRRWNLLYKNRRIGACPCLSHAKVVSLLLDILYYDNN